MSCRADCTFAHTMNVAGTCCRGKEHMTERLKCCAIVRDTVLRQGYTAHWQLRQDIDFSKPDARPGDVEGFMTTHDRFVTRREAVVVGVASGQLSAHWKTATRDLLSSDINWNEGR